MVKDRKCVSSTDVIRSKSLKDKGLKYFLLKRLFKNSSNCYDSDFPYTLQNTTKSCNYKMLVRNCTKIEKMCSNYRTDLIKIMYVKVKNDSTKRT